MKSVARWLIRLYPAEWRARYEQEFEALIEEAGSGWSEIFDLLKGAIQMHDSIRNFPKLALVLAVLGLIGGLGVSYLVPPRYTAVSALTLSDPSNGPLSEARRNLANTFAQYKTNVLERRTLSEVIRDGHLNLYPSERSKMPLEEVIERMQHDLRIELVDRPDLAAKRAIEFQVSFTYPDHLKAAQTVQVLTTHFQSLNIGFNLANLQRPPSAPEQALLSEIARLESRVAELEHKASNPVAAKDDQRIDLAGRKFTLEVISQTIGNKQTSPDRARFMAFGFGSGILAAILFSVFRQQPPPRMPLPASPA